MHEKTQWTLKGMTPAQLFKVRDAMRILEDLNINEVGRDIYIFVNDLILEEAEKTD